MEDSVGPGGGARGEMERARPALLLLLLLLLLQGEAGTRGPEDTEAKICIESALSLHEQISY